MNDLIRALAQAPDSQIDKTVRVRLAQIADMDSTEKQKEELKKVLDDCAYASLASDFAMMSMDMVWRSL